MGLQVKAPADVLLSGIYAMPRRQDVAPLNAPLHGRIFCVSAPSCFVGSCEISNCLLGYRPPSIGVMGTLVAVVMLSASAKFRLCNCCRSDGIIRTYA